jgi:hypothetical protein
MGSSALNRAARAASWNDQVLGRALDPQRIRAQGTPLSLPTSRAEGQACVARIDASSRRALKAVGLDAIAVRSGPLRRC